MAKLTREEVHEYLRLGTQTQWISPQAHLGHTFQSRSVSSMEVAEYVRDLEGRLVRLATALADHLEGKPVGPS